MSNKKKKVKHSAKICFYCQKEFNGWNDKHIHRIDTSKPFNYNNMVCLCEACKKLFSDNNLKIYDIDFTLLVKRKPTTLVVG